MCIAPWRTNALFAADGCNGNNSKEEVEWRRERRRNQV